MKTKLMEFSKIIYELDKINFTRGLFRLSFFISFAVFIWASFVEAPKTLPIAFGFSNEDHKEILEKHGRYSESFKENPDNYISWYFGSSRGRICQLGRESWGDRKGKPCGTTSCEIINKAIDRIIDTECSGEWVDYSYGWLVKNNVYGVIPKLPTFIYEKDHGVSIFYPSEEGYSIIPETQGMLKYSVAFGFIYAVLTFIFFAFVIPALLHALKFLIIVIKRCICWVLKGFIRESFDENSEVI